MYISWGSLSDNDMIRAIKRNAMSLVRLDWQPTDYEHDRDFEEKFFSVLKKEEKIDFVFSFNFLPLVSDCCQRAGIFYVSWIYDSPHLTLYSKTVRNERNVIFHFDRAQAESLKGICPHVFHLPLGVNSDRLGSVGLGKSPAAAGRYMADISFLGSLYTENFFDSISYLPEELFGYLKGLVDAQRLIYGRDVITPCLDDKRIGEIKKYVSFSLGEGYEEEAAKLFSDMFLLRKVSSAERIEIMERLFGEFENVKLYTGSDVSKLTGLRSEGTADYESEMPEVFFRSKINLNISLRTIRSGIPLRAFDIMGAGGFLLSNYQPELLEYFTAGQDFDFYEDIPDLVRKCHYYLEHDEERERIARNGMERVRSEHSLDVKLLKILECLREVCHVHPLL